MDYSSVDLSRLCRTCKNESTDMRPLYTRDSASGKENPRIDEMLMTCASIQVDATDGLPNTICRTCVYQLKNAFAFKELCEQTDQFFRSYVKTSKIKDEHPNDLSTLTNSVICELKELPTEIQNENSMDVSEISDIERDKCDYIELLDNNVMLLTCRECRKVFSTVDGLKSHKRLHTGQLFKCKQCDKEYTRLSHLQRHELSHDRRKYHVCKICNKTLTRFDHLKRHLVIHLKDKPYSCNMCNRGFNRSEHLLNHKKKCKGEPVYICEVCNKAFNRADSLEVHKKIHDQLEREVKLPTLENLDNIKEHYIEVDYDRHIISDESEPEFDDGTDIRIDAPFDDDDYGSTNGASDTKIDDFPNTTDDLPNKTQDNIINDDNFEETPINNLPCEVLVNTEAENDLQTITSSEIYAEEDPPEIMEEKAKIEEELYKENELFFDDGMDNATDSDGSEYSPTKQSPKKRKRGRPRKQKLKKPRGRPPLVKLKIKTEVKQEPGEVSEYPCPECKVVFRRMRELEKHVVVHKGLRLHECKTCGKKFSRNAHLRRHEVTHSEEKPHVCEICQKCFARRDHLQQHVKQHQQTDYPCELCSSVYSRLEQLERHKAVKHHIGEKIVGEKRHKCSICSKGFTTEKYRDVHMKSHTGDKKYRCKTCDKTFISKSHLNEHMKFHSDSSKKFLCSECGQRFIRNDYLIIHMRRHRGEKPFKCKFCGKGFPRTTDLTVHERYHTGEKTHLCMICGRGFGRAYNLTVHMRTHTGEKPYRCSYCDAAFAQGNDLKAHVRRHTGERFMCNMCPDTFLMGYLLTAHKRAAHGLNIVSNIRRLQTTNKVENPEDSPPITVSLPTPVIIPPEPPSLYL